MRQLRAGLFQPATAALLLAVGAIAIPAGRAEGGRGTIFQLTDPRGDDHGSGAICYPLRDDLGPGDLDLIALTAWPEKDGTSFEVTFAAPVASPGDRIADVGGGTLASAARHGFYTLNVDIYVDTDRIPGSGRTAMLPGRRCDVDTTTAWEKLICLTPRPEEAWEQACKWLESTEDSARALVFFPKRIRVRGRTIRFFVPAEFLGGPARGDWAYAVAVSGAELRTRLDVVELLGLAKTPEEPRLMILPVTAGKSTEAFGCARTGDDLEPCLIDVLAPDDRSQEQILSDHDPRTRRWARLPGVVPSASRSR